VLGIRPEDIGVTAFGAGEGIPAVVEVIEHLGSSALVHVRTEASGTKLTALVHSKRVPATGERVMLELHVGNGLLFDQKTSLAVTGFAFRQSAETAGSGSRGL
jgi:multiple sugar transport system ATP-binding protein